MAASQHFFRRALLGALFGALVYAGIIAWLDLKNIRSALEGFPLILVPAALALSFGNYLIRFLKWERYRKLLGIELERGSSFLIYLCGFSMGITPGKMGEVFKSLLIKRIAGTPIHQSAPIVVAERLTDLFGYLILVAIGGIASKPEYQWVFWVTLAACAGGLWLVSAEGFSRLVARVLARTPFLWRVAGKAEGSFASARVLLAPKQLFWPTLQSVASWGLECTAFWLIASAMIEGGVPFLFAVFAYAFSAVAGAVALVFPGGLGITEGSLGALVRPLYQQRLAELGTLGPAVTEEALRLAARSKAAGAVILTRLCTLWFAVAVGLVATAIFRRRHGGLQPD